MYDRRISQRDRDDLAARARKEFWEKKQSEAARAATLDIEPRRNWYRIAYLGSPVGTW